MANLGSRQATGAHDPTNPLGANNWTVQFTPAVIGIQQHFEVYHIAVYGGPVGSNFQVFQDTTFYDAVPRGDLNSWDPSQPMHVQPGRTLYFYFSMATGNAPVISIFCREPTS